MTCVTIYLLLYVFTPTIGPSQIHRHCVLKPGCRMVGPCEKACISVIPSPEREGENMGNSRKPGSSLQEACLNSIGAVRVLARQPSMPPAKRSVPSLVNEPQRSRICWDTTGGL